MGYETARALGWEYVNFPEKRFPAHAERAERGARLAREHR